MGVNIDTKFRLFYVFKHVNGENIRYMGPEGDWCSSLNMASFYEFEESAEYLAKSLAKLMTFADGEYLVVGCVRAEVEPFYDMKVVGGKGIA